MLFFTSKKKFDFEVSKQAAEATEKIIADMGAELHDDLIQKLSIFRLYIDRIEKSSTDPVEIQSLIIKMKNDFEQVVNVIRNISRRLLPVFTQGETLVDMMKMLCQTMEQAGIGHIHLESKGKSKSINHYAEIYLQRIVQELIQNAFRHSSAWHVWVRLTWETEYLIIEVEDDGSAFSKIPELIHNLKTKNNTLKMRSQAIGATIIYNQGSRGLLATVQLMH
jgi:signal transduction histidine kinase